MEPQDEACILHEPKTMQDMDWTEYGKIPPSASTTSSIGHMSTDARNQWYPIALSGDIVLAPSGKRGKPMGTCLLGDPIVLYRDGKKKVRCFADKCPHRSAPLSVGQVVDGVLECKYHGWQFDEAGSVNMIPALQDGKKIPASAKTRAYPCFEKDGCIYVWPGDAELADEASKETIYSHPIQQDPSFVCQEFVLDLPIDHTLMVENLLDPAHIPFTHEGTIGKRSAAEPMKMSMVKVKNGLRGQVKEGFFNMFVAPCWIVLFTPIKPGWIMMQICGCVPSSPGRMRFVYRAYRNWMKFFTSVRFLAPMFNKFSLKIIFQDYEMLFGQQQRLNEGALAWNASIQVDNLPVLYRKWATKTFKEAYWTGWSSKQPLAVEDLLKAGQVNCDGCEHAQPYHPMNPFQQKPSSAGVPLWAVCVIVPVVALLTKYFIG